MAAPSQDSFNEAEAIKPRNPKVQITTAIITAGFNEAEAIKPRNLHPTCPTLHEPPSFNEAEAIKPRNRDPVRRRGVLLGASMRPRQSSLGICRYDPDQRTDSYASMRPRQSSLGIGQTLQRQAPRHLASMRPRQSSLGIGQSSTVRRKPVRTSFNEAEAIKPRNLQMSLPMKMRQNASMRPRQSSLGILAMLDSTRQTQRRFNEAEAIKPRNLAEDGPPVGRPDMLQ